MKPIKPEKKFLNSDLLAGLTFALVNIPQSMAHALLASVNPVLGLYTLMLATPIGALFTSAVFMNISTTSALAVAAGDTLTTYPSSDRGTVLVTLVLLIGVFQVVLGLLRLGWITRFIPFSVMTGSMTRVAGGSSSGTALIISAGARSRWANIFAGVFVAVVVLLFANLVELVAMPALAGLVIVAGIQMVNMTAWS